MEHLHPLESLLLSLAETEPAPEVGWTPAARETIAEFLSQSTPGASLKEALVALVRVAAFFEHKGESRLALGLYELGNAAAARDAATASDSYYDSDPARSQVLRGAGFLPAPAGQLRAPSLGEKAPPDTTKAGALQFVRRVR